MAAVSQAHALHWASPKHPRTRTISLPLQDQSGEVNSDVMVLKSNIPAASPPMRMMMIGIIEMSARIVPTVAPPSSPRALRMYMIKTTMIPTSM